jgi:hypothetical protein
VGPAEVEHAERRGEDVDPAHLAADVVGRQKLDCDRGVIDSAFGLSKVCFGLLRERCVAAVRLWLGAGGDVLPSLDGDQKG